LKFSQAEDDVLLKMFAEDYYFGDAKYHQMVFAMIQGDLKLIGSERSIEEIKFQLDVMKITYKHLKSRITQSYTWSRYAEMDKMFNKHEVPAKESNGQQEVVTEPLKEFHFVCVHNDVSAIDGFFRGLPPGTAVIMPSVQLNPNQNLVALMKYVIQLQRQLRRSFLQRNEMSKKCMELLRKMLGDE